MTRPDHTLQDTTRLHFLTPRAAPPEGLASVSVDLSAFFALVERIGRNEALLLLLVRALRQRTGLFVLKVHDLAWMLRVSDRRVIRWLDRLTHAQLVVYHVEDVFGIDSVAVELPEIRAAHDFAPSSHHDLPSHWFVQVLPLVGRTTFTVYLFFHWSERGNAEVHIDRIVDAVRLRGRFHARLHLGKLRRAGLLRSDPRDPTALVVSDPPPPGRFARVRLRIRAIPHLRRSLAQIAVCIVAAALILAALVILSRSIPPPV